MCLWNANDGKLLSTLPHEEPIRSMAFAPDGKHIITASRDRIMRLWDTKSGKLLKHFLQRAETSHVSFSPDGDVVLAVLAGYPVSGVCLWDWRAGKLLTTLDASMGQYGLATFLFSPDGLFLLTIPGDRVVHLLDARSGKPVATYANPDRITDISFSPDSRYLLIAGENGKAQIVELLPDPRLVSIILQDDVNLLSNRWSPDGRWVWSKVHNDIHIWDASNGDSINTIAHQGRVLGVSFSPDGNQVLTHSRLGARIRSCFWDVTSGMPLRAVLRDRPQLDTFGNDNAEDVSAFTPDGRFVLSRHIKRLDDPSRLLEFARNDFIDPDILVSSIKEAYIWRSADGATMATLPHKETIEFAILSHDGRRAITAGERTIRIWEVPTGVPLGQMPIPLGRHLTKSIGISADGTIVMVGIRAEDHSTLLVTWDVVSESQKSKLQFTKEREAVPLAFSPNGDQALVSVDTSVERWNLRSGKRLAQLDHDRSVSYAAFDKNGDVIITRADDQTVRIWDTVTSKLIAAFPHKGSLVTTDLGPSGTRLLTSCEPDLWKSTSTMQLWDVPSQLPVSTEQLHAIVNTLAQQGFDDAGKLQEFSPAQLRQWREQFTQKVGNNWVQPNSAQWHLGRGSELARTWHWSAAAFHLSRAIALGKDGPQIRQLRGKAYSALSRWDLSVADCRISTLKNPQDAEGWELLGRASAELEDWDGAIRAFGKACALSPANSTFAKELGFAFLGGGDEKNYRAQCRAMAEQFKGSNDPIIAKDVVSLCVVMQESGVSPQTLVSFAEMIRIGGHATEWLLGGTYYRLGRYQTAAHELDRGIYAYRLSTDSQRPLVFMRASSALAHHKGGLGPTDIAQMVTISAIPGYSIPFGSVLPTLTYSFRSRILLELAKQDVEARELGNWELRLIWRRLHSEAESTFNMR